MNGLPAWYGEPRPDQSRALTALCDGLPVDAAFTAAVTTPSTAGSVSAVLATFNRCPFDPRTRLDDNPLYWAIASLRGQLGGALAEIIVADDGSTDHTAAVLGRLARQAHPVPLHVLRLPRHRGAWHARNAAAAQASSRWLYFGDDDCVFAPHTVAGAAYALNELRAHDPAAAAVGTPFYYRGLRPRAVLARKRIGVLDIPGGDFTTGFHAMPAPYLAGEPPTLGAAALLAPLPVGLVGGTVLLDAAALGAAGGFADLSAWRSGYSDHLHLAADLTETGAVLYHCPDPRLSAAHLKFGATGAYPAHPGDDDTTIPILGRTLSGLVHLAAVSRQHTGHRVPDAVFFTEWIGAFFSFFAGRSRDGGRRWAVRCWQDFVRDGNPPSLTVTGVPPLPQRVTSWRTGLARGCAELADQPPRLTGHQIASLVKEVTDACAQPPVTGW